MFLVALTLTFLGGLTVARRIVEPACPACSAKNWKDEPQRLECASCGWASVAAAVSPQLDEASAHSSAAA